MRSDDTGAIAILVAIFAVVMFGFAAVIVDLGVARTTTSKAQDSADASALAAANVLYPDSGGRPALSDYVRAVDAAKAYAFANYQTNTTKWAACTDANPLSYQVPGNTACISFDHGPLESQPPTQVRVRIPNETVKSFFGGVVGYRGLTVAASAKASVAETAVVPDCVFCVLGAGTHNFASGQLTILKRDIWVNGNMNVDLNGRVTTPEGSTYVQGTANRPSPPQISSSVQGAGAVLDPLNLPPPDISSLPIGVNPCGPSGPGRYGAITLNGPGTCTMTPGVYVFTEPLTVSGTQRLVANGVTFVFACGSGGNITGCGPLDPIPGRLVISGSPDFNLSAPTSAPNKGLAIYYADGNTAALSINGVSAGSLTGTIYGPDATLEVNFPACGAIDSMVVVADVVFGGSDACFSTSYTPALNVPVTSAAGSGLVP